MNMNRKKVFISQPMFNKSNKQILQERLIIIKKLKELNFDIIDSVLTGSIEKSPIEYLAESIKLMSDADIVYMMRGWQKARGCKIEHEVACCYGKDIYYE